MRLVFLLTNGFVARMVLRTDVVKRLGAEGAQVTVVSPNANEAYFQRECETADVALLQAPKAVGRLAQWFRVYRSYLLDDVMHNAALRAGHVRRFESRPVLGCAAAALNRSLARWPLFRRMSRGVERRLNRSASVRALLHDVRPDLLVLPNPFGAEETLYLLHAKELGIPVVCQMLSWDNITSKGTPLLMPDYFISWGPVMTEELVQLYRFPKERIHECGVPHFDVYSQKEQLTPRDLLLSELHLAPKLPYLFYGMVTGIHCPNELAILTWLADQINRDAFALPCSLIIRPHPQTISGLYARSAGELDALKALTGPRVALDIPHVLSEELAWDLPKPDMYRLASLLAGCAICLNASSTLCLDACMLDRPVIDIGFDGREFLPYERSARRSLDYTHMARLLAFGGIRIARSFPELEQHINMYFKHPEWDRETRLLAAAQECGPRDGRAAERVAAALLQWIVDSG